jgi:hypothetical protein
MMSAARIEALDRRKSAVHEAGHEVIARHVGAGCINAWIHPTETNGVADPLLERTWNGHCRVLLSTTTAESRRMIAVAGAVAERVCGVWGDAPNAYSLIECFEWSEDTMSPADWKMAGVEPGKPDDAFMQAVEDVIDLLDGPLKPELYATARELIVDARPELMCHRIVVAEATATAA